MKNFCKYVDFKSKDRKKREKISFNFNLKKFLVFKKIEFFLSVRIDRHWPDLDHLKQFK